MIASGVDRAKPYLRLNVDVGLRLPDGNWEFSLCAKKLTNTFRIITNEGLRSTSPLSHGTFLYTNYDRITVTEPREFGINARFAFSSH